MTVYPEAGLLEKRKAERDAKLKSKAEGLSAAQKSQIREQGAALDEAMARPDSPEAIATLPRLRKADLPRKVESIERNLTRIAGLEAVVHPLFTNGIVYLDMAFPLDSLAREALAWLPLTSRFTIGAGLVGEGYDRVAQRLARSAGGFGASLDSGTPASGAPGTPGKALSHLVIRLKALTERFPQALELVLSLLTGADHGDLKRVEDIHAELRNDVLSAVVPAGNAFAQTRAASRFGEASAIEELWRGTSQVRFLLDLKGAEAAVLAQSMSAVSLSVFARKGLRLNITAEQGALAGVVAALESALPSLPAEAAAFAPRPGAFGPAFAPANGGEAYAISSQVGFAAAAFPSSKLGSAFFGHESLLAHVLSTGPLWEELRVKRGAYGASVWTDGLEGIACFSSYRDPRPVEALSFFGEALAEAQKRFSPGGAGSEAEVEEAAIGAIGRELRPMLPEERGFVDFRRWLYGIADDLRQSKRDAMLAAGAGELAAAAGRLAASYQSAEAVLISRAEDVQSMLREVPGTLVVELPL